MGYYVTLHTHKAIAPYLTDLLSHWSDADDDTFEPSEIYGDPWVEHYLGYFDALTTFAFNCRSLNVDMRIWIEPEERMDMYDVQEYSHNPDDCDLADYRHYYYSDYMPNPVEVMRMYMRGLSMDSYLQNCADLYKQVTSWDDDTVNASLQHLFVKSLEK